MDHPATGMPSGSRNTSLDSEATDALFLRSYDLDRSHRLRIRVRDDEGHVTAETSHRLPPGGFDVLPLDGRAASVEVGFDGVGSERPVEPTDAGAERAVEPTATDAERTDTGATVIECGADGVRVAEWPACR